MINNLILLHAKTQRVGNDRPWLLLKTIDAKSSSLKLMAASQQSLAALFSLLQLPIVWSAKNRNFYLKHFMHIHPPNIWILLFYCCMPSTLLYAFDHIIIITIVTYLVEFGAILYTLFV